MKWCAMVFGIVASLLVISPAIAQVPSRTEADRIYKDMRPDVREAAETYLRTDCEIGEVRAALNSLLKVAEEVKPYLFAVQREGPPSPVVGVFERGLDDSWRLRQEFLKTPDALELGRESFEMMKVITEEQYRKDQRQAIQAKYRERAALALKAMSGR